MSRPERCSARRQRRRGDPLTLKLLADLNVRVFLVRRVNWLTDDALPMQVATAKARDGRRGLKKMPGGVAVPNPRGFDECACAVDVDEFKKRQDQFKRREEGAAGAGAGDVSIGGSDVVARVLMCCCRCGTVQYSTTTW